MHISIIGSGNVAWHIAQAVVNAHHIIDSVASMHAANALQLAQKVGAKCCSVQSLPITSDIYIIAVTDKAIADVANQIPLITNGIVVHTSGATSVDVLARQSHYGVLYPCQTFSRDAIIDYCQLPFFIEGNDTMSVERIEQLACSISGNVRRATSEQRKQLHVAAVLASNFTNHLLLLAKQQMQDNGLDFQMLRQLVVQTVFKAFDTDPLIAQTGPARRHDSITIAAHRALITNPTTLAIYNLMTNSIEETYNK